MNNPDTQTALNPWLRWLGLLASAFSHPFYLLVAFYLLLATGLTTETGTNVFLIDLLPFCTILIFICGIRFWIFSKIIAKIQLNRQERLNWFVKINLWSAPGLFIFVMMLMPVEGNVFGFIFIPVILIFGAIIGPLILIKSIRLPRKLLTNVSSK